MSKTPHATHARPIVQVIATLHKLGGESRLDFIERVATALEDIIKPSITTYVHAPHAYALAMPTADGGLNFSTPTDLATPPDVLHIVRCSAARRDIINSGVLPPSAVSMRPQVARARRHHLQHVMLWGYTLTQAHAFCQTHNWFGDAGASNRTGINAAWRGGM